MKKSKIVIPVDASIQMNCHEFSDGEFVWNIAKLIDASKGLPVFDLPLAGINLSTCPWNDGKLNIIEFAEHYKRTKQANLSYPIILDSEGIIADGWHRVTKALLKGKTSIKAVRLLAMPPCDRKEKF